MSVSGRFPNELWLEVMQHLSQMELRSVAASNRTLLHLARDFLFRHVKIRFCTPIPGDGRWNPHIPAADSLARIALFTSPDIASRARSGRLRCVRIHEMQERQPVLRLADGETRACGHFLALFLEHSRRFANLRRLELDNLVLDHAAYHAVANLPALKELVINWTDLWFGELPTRRLELVCLSYYGRLGLDSNLRLIDPSLLHTVYVGFNDETFTLDGLTRLDNLERLAINSASLGSDLGHHDLSRLTPTTFPRLRAFSGLLDFALHFIENCHLERLFIDELYDTSLRYVTIAPDKAACITTLGINNISLEHEELCRIVNMFPNLTVLAISACDYDAEWYEERPLYEELPGRDLIDQLLATVAPATLTELHVTLYWTDSIATTKQIFADPAPSHAGPLAAGLIRCPLLRAIYIVLDGSRGGEAAFAMSWERHPGGFEERHTTEDVGKATKLRQWMLPHRIAEMWGF
ncbi:hypothetical protein MIND_01243800 [Mycena indigotica]|uniref:F-box domain-containing protein n=1 Tax=Mycena indigotica TaxID=2126181 RepID=A0A8H6S5G1_9AGAR|nr:uncharacterized protein MIND_01243800 [Mycena indigotica]KAF7292167.1 hypothetical protein MIND_01243800 [Mycena indigotica]